MENSAAGLTTHLQFASEGRWERALRIARETPDPRGLLNSWLEEAPQDVALEVFFAASGEAVRFLGMRLEALPRPRQSTVLRALVTAFLATPMTAEETAVLLRSLLGEPSLFGAAPDFYELGMLDAWVSFGPLRFWAGRRDCDPCQAFEDAILGNPRFLWHSDQPFAIEGGYALPLPHWWGAVVSESHLDGWSLDLRQALDVLRTWVRNGAT
jgi:hypothetical protein